MPRSSPASDSPVHRRLPRLAPCACLIDYVRILAYESLSSSHLAPSAHAHASELTGVPLCPSTDASHGRTLCTPRPTVLGLAYESPSSSPTALRHVSCDHHVGDSAPTTRLAHHHLDVSSSPSCPRTTSTPPSGRNGVRRVRLGPEPQLVGGVPLRHHAYVVHLGELGGEDNTNAAAAASGSLF